MRRIYIAIFIFAIVLFSSCREKVQFFIDYDSLELEYEKFGDELIEKYLDDLSVGYDYTIKLYQDKFNLNNNEIRMLGDWTKVSSYYGGEPNFIFSKPKREVHNDVRSVKFYANRVCVVNFYWNTYLFGSWKINDDKQLILNIKYMIESENDNIVTLLNYKDPSDIILLPKFEFDDYYIILDGFNYAGFPNEFQKKYRIKEDVPRVKHSFYWPGENHFDPKYVGGKILYNFEWNENSVKNMYDYFFTKENYINKYKE